MITEDYVSFEIAKLLKEKGFDGECIGYYWDMDKTFDIHYELLSYSDGNLRNEIILAPTLQMAMKWLRDTYKLHITVVPNPLNFEHQDIQDGWGCEVTHLSDLSFDGDYEFFQKKYPTHEEACEAAINYCLKYLI